MMFHRVARSVAAHSLSISIRAKRSVPRYQVAGLLRPQQFVGSVSTLRIGGKPSKEKDGLVENGSQEKKEHEEEDTSLSERTKTRLSRLGVVGSGLILLAGKTKYVLVALKLTKVTSIFSLLASTAAYSFLYGLPFAAGMVGMLLVHESGHAAMMRSLGIPTTPMLFVPFMGAVVGMRDQPKSAYEHAQVALAGPIVGGLAAAGVAATGVMTDSQFLMALGDFGLMINVFNLLPIANLDGGVVAGTLSRWFLVGGMGAGAAMIYTGAVSNPLFYLIMFGGGFTTFQRFFGDQSDKEYYEIPRSKKIMIGSSYLALIAALLATMNWNNRYRKTPAQIRAEQARSAQPMESKSDLEEAIFGWSNDYQDHEYFKGTGDSSLSSETDDPFFEKQKKW